MSKGVRFAVSGCACIYRQGTRIYITKEIKYSLESDGTHIAMLRTVKLCTPLRPSVRTYASLVAMSNSYMPPYGRTICNWHLPEEGIVKRPAPVWPVAGDNW